jgi:chaperonin cofactor prefoldin
MEDKEQENISGPISVELKKLNIQFATAQAETNTRFDKLESQIRGTNARFDKFENQIGEMNNSMERYFGAVNLEFGAVRREMRDEFATLRKEMHDGFSKLATKEDMAATRKDVGEVLARVKNLEEDNTRAHSLDLHKRVRRIEKHLFEKAR